MLWLLLTGLVCSSHSLLLTFTHDHMHLDRDALIQTQTHTHTYTWLAAQASSVCESPPPSSALTLPSHPYVTQHHSPAKEVRAKGEGQNTKPPLSLPLTQFTATHSLRHKWSPDWRVCEPGSISWMVMWKVQPKRQRCDNSKVKTDIINTALGQYLHTHNTFCSSEHEQELHTEKYSTRYTYKQQPCSFLLPEGGCFHWHWCPVEGSLSWVQG